MSGSTRAIVLTLSVKDAETVRAQLEQMGAAGETALRRLEAASARTAGGGGSLPKVKEEAEKTSGALGNMGYVAQQAGYQFGDLAIQIQGGQNALVAISQQGSQFLGMFGPAGAVAGVVLTIGTIAANFLLTADNAEKAKDSSADAFKAMQAGAAATAELIEKVNNQFRSTEEIAARIANKAQQAMRLQLSSQIDSFEPVRANLRQQLDQEARTQQQIYGVLNDPRFGGTNLGNDPEAQRNLTASQNRAHELANQLLEVEANARKAKAALNSMHQGVYGAEEFGPTSADPNGTEALRASLDRRVAAQQAYANRVRDIQAQLRDGYIEGSEAERLSALATKERDDAIESLTKKTRGLTDAQKAENAEIAAMSQIIRDINRDYDKHQDDQMRAREREEDQRKREAETILRRQRQQAERSTDEVVRYTSDMFADMFSSTEGGWNRMWDNMRRTAVALAARIGAEAIIRPLVTPVVSSIIGAGGVEGTAGRSLFGGLGQTLGLSGMGNQLGIPGMGSLFNGASNLLNTPLWSSGTQMFGPMSAAAPTTAFYGSTTAGQLLGGAGLGFGAGSLLNSLVGGKSLGGTVGSGAGGLAGAALGSIVPGVGTLLGGLIGGGAGGLLGGMFGANPQSPASSVQIGIGADGQLTIMGDRSKGMSSAEGIAAAQQTIAGLNSRVSASGLSLRQSSGAVAQTHQGNDARPGADAEEMTRVVLGSLQGGSAAVMNIIARELAKGASASIDRAFSDIDWVKSTYDPLSRTTPAVSEFEQALDALNVTYGNAIERANGLGLATTDMAANMSKAIAEATAARDLQYRQTSDTLVARAMRGRGDEMGADLLMFDVGAGQERTALETQLRAQGATGEAYASQMARLEEALWLERKQIAERGADALVQASEQAQRSATQSALGVITSLADYSRSLAVGNNSPLSAQEQYGIAERQFNAVSGAAVAGDARSLSSLQGYADTYLQASRSLYGSTSGYSDAYNRVQSTLGQVGDLSVDTLTASFYALQQQDLKVAVVNELQAVRAELVAQRREFQQLVARGGIAA